MRKKSRNVLSVVKNLKKDTLLLMGQVPYVGVRKSASIWGEENWLCVAPFGLSKM